MEQLFDLWARSDRANQLALDLTSRQPPFKAIVTQDRDPEERRRILVTEAAAVGVNSYWVRRLRTESQLDAIMPVIGQEVLVLPVDGDFIDGYYLIIEGDTDPPFNKIDGNKDRWQDIPNDSTIRVGRDAYLETTRDSDEVIGRDLNRDVKRNVLDKIAGTFTQQVQRAIDIFSKVSVLVHLFNNSKFEMKETGEISIFTPIGSGVVFTPDGQINLFLTNLNLFPPIGGTGTTTPINLGGMTIQLNNGSLIMTSMNSVKINTKDVATVGAIDTDNDTLTTKGWS